MCFSPQISFTFFIAGVVLTYLSYVDPVKRASKMYILFAFYSVMELLQTIQYFFVNQCDLPVNVLSTEFAYLLVIVQPLMWNIIFYMKSKNETTKNIFKLAIVLCAIWIVMNVYTRISYDPAISNEYNKCGLFNHTKTCTYRDTETSHLYWRWKTHNFNDMTPNYFMYMCLWFVPALLVAETRLTGMVLLMGAVVGYIITRMYGNSVVEFPAIWCYISVPILALGYMSFL